MNAVAALPDGRVRQADDGEGRHPARDVGLDLYREAVEALEAEALEDCVHGALLSARQGAAGPLKFLICAVVSISKKESLHDST